jgi:hypothetical protein
MCDIRIRQVETELYAAYLKVENTKDVFDRILIKGTHAGYHKQHCREYVEANHQIRILTIYLDELKHRSGKIPIDENRSVEQLDSDILGIQVDVKIFEKRITYHGYYPHDLEHKRFLEIASAEKAKHSALYKRLTKLRHIKAREPVLCIAMGFHSRLGAKSQLNLLPETVVVDLILIFLEQTEKPEIITTVKPVNPVVQSRSMFQTAISSAMDFPFQAMLIVSALLYAAFTFCFGDRQVHMKGGKICRIERGFYRVGK